jgi:hypothetical protein
MSEIHDTGTVQYRRVVSVVESRMASPFWHVQVVFFAGLTTQTAHDR